MIVHYCDINHKVDMENLALAIGNFDGVHIGHQKILMHCVSLAKRYNLVPAVLTFSPHTSQLVQTGKNNKKLIYNNKQKINVIKNLNIAHIFIFKFDIQIMNISHNEFIKNILIKQFKVKCVVTGYNFFFGKDRLGDVSFLKKQSEFHGFIFNSVNKLKQNYIDVSSSKIRYLLSKGMIESVNKILGRCYSITATVVHGDKLARTLGFSTANLNLTQEQIYPLSGVYLVRVIIDDNHGSYFGVANIGCKPTVAQNKTISLEVHILKFNQNIYDTDITIEFINFLRPERRFKDLKELQYQIQKDIDNAKYITEKRFILQ